MFGEAMTWTKALGLVLIISGAVLLNMSSTGAAH
jgi:multidrug transporter EmrE-like cation transporter